MPPATGVRGKKLNMEYGMCTAYLGSLTQLNSTENRKTQTLGAFFRMTYRFSANKMLRIFSFSFMNFTLPLFNFVDCHYAKRTKKIKGKQEKNA